MPEGTGVLERRYHRLLAAYPARYRAERGAEIVATLLDDAGPGQRRPRPAEVVDLVQAGLLERCRFGRVPGLAAGLVAAAPVALALAAGISAFLWWRVEPETATVNSPQRWPFEGVITLGPVAYAAWLFAALARAACRPAVGRFAIAAAIAATVVVVPVLAATPIGQRPPLWVLMALAGFGTVALLGTATGLGAGEPTTESRLSGLAGAVAVAVCTVTLTQAWIPASTTYYGSTISRVGAVVVTAVAAVAVIAAFHLFRGRPAHDRLWAAALLGLPAGWLGPFDLTNPTLEGSAPHFGRLAQVLFATCVAVAVMYRLVQRPPGRGPDRATPHTRAAALTRAGWHAVGTAAGLASWIALAHLGVSGPRPEPGAGPPAYVLATLVALGTVGLAAGATGRGAGAWRHLLSSAAVTAVAAWLIAAYVNDWTLRAWDDFGHTAAVATAVALVPLSECAVAAARARRTLRTRWAATAVLVAALGWLAVLTIQYLPGWAPPLLGTAACVAASRVPRRRPA